MTQSQTQRAKYNSTLYDDDKQEELRKKMEADEEAEDRKVREELDALRRPKEKPLTLRERYTGFRSFMGILNQPNNSIVAQMFFATSFVMFVLPIVTFLVMQKFVGPQIVQIEDAAVNTSVAGFTAVGATVLISAYFTVWAIRHDAKVDKMRESDKKKKQ